MYKVVALLIPVQYTKDVTARWGAREGPFDFCNKRDGYICTTRV